MKKVLAIILTLVLFISLAPCQHAHAAEMIDPATGLRYEEIVSGYAADPDFEWEKEIIIYIDNEDELFKFEFNPNYRYIYQWESPSLTRAVCYNCGKSTMSTVTELAQWGCDYKDCPLSFGTGLENDYYNEWFYKKYERCTSCGFSGRDDSNLWWEENSNNRVFTSVCSNGDNPGNGAEWQVLTASQFDINQHNIHQYKPWWESKIRPY